MQRNGDGERPRFFQEDLDAANDDKGSSLFVEAAESSDELVDGEVIADKARFVTSLKEVLGSVPGDILEDYWTNYGASKDGLSKAIQQHFEGKGMNRSSDTSENFDTEEHKPAEAPVNEYETLQSKRGSSNEGELHFSKRKKRLSRWRRFLGSTQVNAMATRPTSQPLKYGSELLIRRTSGQLNSGFRGRKKPGFSQYVRFCDAASSRELGRLPEDISEILHTLIQTPEVEFKATMIFCNSKRLSVGDLFVVRLDCFVTSSLFDSVMPRNAEDERYQQRNRALMLLFKSLNMTPLVEGAEMIPEKPEIYDLEEEGCVTDTAVDSPTTSDDYMDLNQLRNFYRSTQESASIFNLRETTPPVDKFKLELRSYQKQGLTWMLLREREHTILAPESRNDSADEPMDPMWRMFKWPRDTSWDVSRGTTYVDLETDIPDKFYANLHTGEFSLVKPISKSVLKGGILADEMGLGKTISILGLITMVPSDTEHLLKIAQEKPLIGHLSLELGLGNVKPYAANTTLIVVPMSLLPQWRNEFERVNNGNGLYCEVYYAGNVSNLRTLLLKQKSPPTVLLTTYGVVQTEWSKLQQFDYEASNEGLFSVEFFRIILDEGHNIRNRVTKTSKAVIGLASRRKWVLTGTPIMNRLDDLFSLIKFLNFEPWCQIDYWRQFVSDPFEKKDYSSALEVIQAVMGPILLRRTKSMKDSDGKPLVQLPPKEVFIEMIQFSNAEAALYKHFLSKAEHSVKESLARGDLLKKYSTILLHILRLRQVCCHFKLLGSQDENDEDLKNMKLINDIPDISTLLSEASQAPEGSGTDISDVIEDFKVKYPNNDLLKDLECSICTCEAISPLTSAVFTRCGHAFCESCLLEYIQFQNKKGSKVICPNCRAEVESSYLLKLEDSNGTLEPVPYNNTKKSSKIVALIRHLKHLQETSANEQVVVFSQFSSYLDILETELKNSFASDICEIYKFDGRLDLKERSNVLAKFTEKSVVKMKVLLLSLKAGGVGLNLTCASHAFIMDPWWSPGMEDQAMDRIHRIGQSSTVKIYRFIVENSIEEKMLRIQEKKRSLGEFVDADEDERRRSRIEEIKMLFA
ncbi:AaceriAFR220Wp [[Ashbya] aceris (nom. inval.)]|nr:AaceriAFR220Wp [[Ashbya] aceris (nom. inval.)]